MAVKNHPMSALKGTKQGRDLMSAVRSHRTSSTPPKPHMAPGPGHRGTDAEDAATHKTIGRKPGPSKEGSGDYGAKTSSGGRGKVTKHSKAHPGFKAVANKIAARQGVSVAEASAMLASRTRSASATAKRKNPRLRKV